LPKAATKAGLSFSVTIFDTAEGKGAGARQHDGGDHREQSTIKQ